MLYVLIAALVFGAAAYIKISLEGAREKEFPKKIRGNISIERVRNSGFALRKLDKHTTLVRVVSAIIMVPVTIFFIFAVRSKKGNAMGKLGAAFLLGGAASNVYERLVHGYVLDYIRLPIKKIRRIVFNIADFFIFIGAVLSAMFVR